MESTGKPMADNLFAFKGEPMENIFEIVSSPWIAGAIAAIPGGLIAAYLKPFLDKQISRFSKWRCDRLQKREKERSNFTTLLRRNKHLQTHEYFRVVEYKFQSFLSFILAIFLLSLVIFMDPLPNIVKTIVVIVSAMCFVRGIQCLKRAENLIKLIKEANRNESEQDKEFKEI